jgi:hypothetical protein
MSRTNIEHFRNREGSGRFLKKAAQKLLLVSVMAVAA